MVAFDSLRQSWALVRKNLIINLRRHFVSTLYRAFVLPVIFVAFLSFSRNLLVPPSTYGIGSPAAVRDLGDALAAKPNTKLLFVNNALGGEVDTIIATMEEELKSRGTVMVIENEIALRTECKQSLRGVSRCFAAIVFESSPNTGEGGNWKYTVRGDISFNDGRVNVDDHDSAVQEVLVPIQLAVDRAIAKQEGRTDVDSIRVSEYMYTSLNQDEFDAKLRARFSAAVINYLSAAYLIGMIGIVYHLTGFQAMEREKGLSTLIEAMGGSKFARMVSYHISFSLIYIAGWIVMALNLWGGIFNSSSVVIIIIWLITSGWALASWALFLGAFFKKAQLSGISATVFSLILGIIAQVSKDASTGTFAVLGFLFPPMTYVFHAISLGRWESKQIGANVLDGPPSSTSQLPIVAYWIFSIVQALVYPILAAYVERYLFSTTSSGHRHFSHQLTDNNALEIRGFTKRYPPRLLTKWFGRPESKESVIAVNDLNLSVVTGQILVLLGANGSGKTTTLEAVAGLGSVKEGEINIAAGDRAIGICPQKNVLWDDMTVDEHVRIWNLIKCRGDDQETLRKLIDECDLTRKRHTKSKALSGGQKRKLQLAAMFTGGSTVCAIDEVSSGLDPLSRRKIWDIVLAARGFRTIIMTSHFLDEADLLADHIAILSKGHLKCEGSAVQLKTEYGGGYRVHAPINAPALAGVSMKRFYDATIYNIPTPTEASRVIEALETNGVSDYYVQGPTIEDVFLSVADESIANRSENTGEREKLGVSETADQISSTGNSDTEEKKGVSLHNGRHLGIFQQTWVLIRKRITILQRNYLAQIAAIAIPIIAAGITKLTFKSFPGVSCNTATQVSLSDVENLTLSIDFDMLLGPRSILSSLVEFADILLPSGTGGSGATNMIANLTNSLAFANTLPAFNDYIRHNYKNVTPGGLFLEGKTATYAYQGDKSMSLRGAMMFQNVVDNIVFNVTGGISATYLPFDYIWPKGQGDTMIFVAYAGLAFSAFPAFFALYPTVERIKNVRALHFSNGVRALPLWLAYALFDFASVLIISVICTGIFAAATDGWYNLGYLFVVVLLYGVASTVLVYCISLITKSQLSAFAFAAGGQAVFFLVYLITYLSIYTFVEPIDLDHALDVTNYVFCALSPIACLTHAFFVALNSFSISCEGESLISYPGTMRLYGSSILFLCLQMIVLFAILVLHDSGKLRINFGFLHRSSKPTAPRDAEDNTFSEKDISDELQRVDSSNDGLRVMHLSKKFKKFQAVDDVTFGVPRGEVFALLGPNGAGKTTTINMIRGELPATSGEIFVQNILVNKNRAAARQHLGVCPQFDAMDRMTVTEHLVFYARIRGVENVDYNVDEVIRAVGLDDFRYRIAEKLSGGNKRKLSLAIALMGNPAVLLLDEPSSGMDAAAKRVMWRTLESVVPGRSLVLTTHSMEECSALAGRAGILAKRMLALGTTEQLRRRYGDKYLVHIVLASAPHSTEAEMNTVNSWISSSFPGAELEPRSFGGQVRFSIPASEGGGVAAVFKRLESQGPQRGCKFWSVDRGTMDMVFLEVVGRAQVQEEGYDEDVKKKMWKKVAMAVFAPWMFLIR
ncbi:hypothetical protein BZA05DRAFT_208292 [Tricharina praecox]|uniref:uncharacterized protein n=1 Tax=Tricharina praecox TaxID=43433 RepID=UPI00221FFE9B|nr:uncharacterized protein BZA05DRAFT_208292 [Tricharina praecox]KAI5842092.1 hypothetical protein BZA05DRAFT_208292 [Tricharina praecox]